MVDASEAPFKYKLLPALVQICGRCHRNVLLGVPYLCLLHPSPQTSWTHFSLSVHIFLPLMFFMSDCLSFDRGTHKSLLSVWLINELLLSQSGYFVSCQGLRAPAAAYVERHPSLHTFIQPSHSLWTPPTHTHNIGAIFWLLHAQAFNVDACGPHAGGSAALWWAFLPFSELISHLLKLFSLVQLAQSRHGGPDWFG